MSKFALVGFGEAKPPRKSIVIVACAVGGIAAGRWPLLRAYRAAITLLTLLVALLLV
jgi:hypothetical protein